MSTLLKLSKEETEETSHLSDRVNIALIKKTWKAQKESQVNLTDEYETKILKEGAGDMASWKEH